MWTLRPNGGVFALTTLLEEASDHVYWYYYVVSKKYFSMQDTLEVPRSNGREKLIAAARFFYLAGVVLAIVLVVPAAWFPLEIGKLAAFTTCLAIAGILFVLGGGMRGLFRGVGMRAWLLVALLPLAYLLSFYFSIDRTVGFSSLAFDTDTVLFTILGFLSLVLGYGLFQSLRNTRILLSVIFASLIVAAIFQCISLAFGTAVIPFQTFADRSVNLVGKWNDLGLLMGILVLWSLVQLQWHTLPLLRRVLLIGLTILTVILLGFIQFTVVWALICAFSILFVAVAYFLHRPPSSHEGELYVPWYPVIIAIVSILFLVYGSNINTNLSKVVPVSAIEVRPAYSSTISITQISHSNFLRSVVGTGPNTFGKEWMLYKPSGVNTSLFWSIDFSVGYSTLLTAFESVGLLGAIAWLIPLLITLFTLTSILRSSRTSVDKRIGATLGIAASYLWVSSILYAPSQNLVLLAFIFTGAFIGFVYASQSERPPSISRLTQGFIGLIALALVVGLLSIAYQSDRLFLSESYVNEGLIALNNGTLNATLSDVIASERYGINGDNLRLQLQATATEVQQLTNATSTLTTAQQQAFETLTQQTLSAGKEAITLNPQDYRPYLLLGQFYALLSSLNVQGAYQLAQNMYAEAATNNPNDPQIPLFQAELDAANGSATGTQQFLTKALTLKQNYTDAILLAVQLDVAENNIPNALQEEQAAIQSDPGVASLWFELGLLYYVDGNTASAIQPLQEAIQLQSNYANAQYFLGLSYYAQGQKSEAISLFQNLEQTNPGDASVALILSNMEAGKAPFPPSKSPVTSPASKGVAPIPE